MVPRHATGASAGGQDKRQDGGSESGSELKHHGLGWAAVRGFKTRRIVDG